MEQASNSTDRDCQAHAHSPRALEERGGGMMITIMMKIMMSGASLSTTRIDTSTRASARACTYIHALSVSAEEASRFPLSSVIRVLF